MQFYSSDDETDYEPASYIHVIQQLPLPAAKCTRATQEAANDNASSNTQATVAAHHDQQLCEWFANQPSSPNFDMHMHHLKDHQPAFFAKIPFTKARLEQLAQDNAARHFAEHYIFNQICQPATPTLLEKLYSTWFTYLLTRLN